MDEERDWAVRIILDIADPLLGSQEIRQALHQVHASEDSMRSILEDHAGDLIVSPALMHHNFNARIDWNRITDPMSAGWLAFTAIMIVIFFEIGLLIFVGWRAALVALVAVSYLVMGVIFALTRLQPWTPLAPDSETFDGLRRRVVGPFLREQLNRLLDEQDYPVELRVTTAPGLAELSDREQIVATEAVTRLAELRTAMPTGNLGVSGPRGAGKTTLLRNFCDATLQWRDDSQAWGRSDLRLMVSAPVDYDAREFILHLFGRLCETVLGTVRGSQDADELRADAKRRYRTLVVLPGIVCAAAGAALVAWDLATRPRRVPHLTTLDLSLALGAALFLAGAGLLGASARHRRARRDGPLSLQAEARTWLTRLRYLQAFTTGYSGTLRLPAGTQLETSTTRQLTELQLTLPDLVERYRDFAERTALWYSTSWPGSETPGRITIGIDELDKIGDAAACERFLNDIKAIFGIPHCTYLVSVSDDALAAFEQRAFVARTTFDTAFDEVVRVGYLDFEAASSLLRSRVAGLPRPVIALCHVLSGGLPRDLIRAVRSLIDVCAKGRSHVADLCEAMVKEEIDTLKSACLSALAADPDQLNRTGLLSRLLETSWPGTSCRALLHVLDQDLRRPETPRNFCVAVYFYATVSEVFGPGLTATIDALRARDSIRTAGAVSHQADESSIDRLAHARNALSGNPDVAWELITRFRTARQLIQPDRPWPSGPGTPGDGSIPRSRRRRQAKLTE
jgi:hypothetical protein